MPKRGIDKTAAAPPLQKTRYQLLVEDWKDCRRCALSRHRNKVVMARGRIPCDVLFVGEGPGDSEDSLGVPFAEGAPSGGLLCAIIRDGIRGKLCGKCRRYETADSDPCPDCDDVLGMREVRLAFANLVGCIPRDEEGHKMGAPDDEHVEACRPRLERLARICDPELIVCVGSTARTFLEPGLKISVRIPRSIPRIDIYHPSFMLRQNLAQKRALADRSALAIERAIEETFRGRCR